jgi:hypothetical protein
MKMRLVMLDRSCYLRAVKNDISAAAKALGRLGGLKGGKARAAKLTPEQRTEIAKKAAAKRWSKTSSHSPQQDAPTAIAEGALRT